MGRKQKMIQEIKALPKASEISGITAFRKVEKALKRFIPKEIHSELYSPEQIDKIPPDLTNLSIDASLFDEIIDVDSLNEQVVMHEVDGNLSDINDFNDNCLSESKQWWCDACNPSVRKIHINRSSTSKVFTIPSLPGIYFL